MGLENNMKPVPDLRPFNGSISNIVDPSDTELQNLYIPFLGQCRALFQNFVRSLQGFTGSNSHMTVHYIPAF